MASRASWDIPQPVEIIRRKQPFTFGYALTWIGLFGLITAIWMWQKFDGRRNHDREAY